MRLEDWQKFIESQFLEGEEIASSPDSPQPLPKQSVESAPPLYKELEPQSLSKQPEKTAPLPPMEIEPQQASASAEVTERPASLQMYPSFLTKGRKPKPELAEIEPTPDAPIRSPFVPITLNDEETPEFGAYLPSFAVTESVVETLTETEPTPTHLAIEIAPEPISATVIQEALPEPAKKRVPKSRARHLRQSSEEEPAKEISSSELWSGIPKYIETLLAMERTNEAEVAQYSYKSPFLEKRRELIQRILDPELSLEETARLLCVCPTTVRRYTNRGILRCFRKEITTGRTESAVAYDTRQRRFRLTDILLFLETHGEALDKDRRHDAKTLFAPSPVIRQAYPSSQEREL